MLPRKERVSKQLFPVLVKKSRSYNSDHLILRVSNLRNLPKGSFFFKKGETSNLPKLFSFTVSKKVAKHAFRRNTLRRRGYSLIKERKNDFERGFAYLFFFKKKSKELSSKAIGKEIDELIVSLQNSFYGKDNSQND
jgi:ribonuclease P protein component